MDEFDYRLHGVDNVATVDAEQIIGFVRGAEFIGLEIALSTTQPGYALGPDQLLLTAA